MEVSAVTLTEIEQRGGEKASRECPECHSKKNWKDGTRETSLGSVQRFVCRDCGFRFSEKSNIESSPISGRQLCVILEEAKKLEPQTETKTVAGEKGTLVEYAWKLKKRGLQDETIKVRQFLLNQLIAKGADLFNPDSVETILATEKYSAAKKKQLVSAYNSFCKFAKVAWEPIRVKYEPKQPFIPTHEEINALIHAASKRTATFLQVAKDTGAREGEICKLEWTDINTESKTIAINHPKKHSRSRTLHVTQKTIDMVQSLPRKYGQRVFNPNRKAIQAAVRALVKRLAESEQNPRYLQIHTHTFRHFFACNLFRRTQILKTVQDALGHKSIQNTEIYTRLVVFGDEKYDSATATTLEELRKLAEDGWTYFQEIDGVKVFKRPKCYY